MDFSLKHLDQLQRGTVVVVGMPTDENSTFMRGPALAPARIREVMDEGSSNLCSESGIDLSGEQRFRDLGDLGFTGAMDALKQIEDAVGELLDRGVYVIALGGDHAVTYAIMKAYHTKYEVLNILHRDAHPDLYDEYEGNRYSHACPFENKKFSYVLITINARMWLSMLDSR